MKSGAFSVSINTRSVPGPFWTVFELILQGVLSGMRENPAWALRRAFETIQSFDEAVDYLANVTLDSDGKRRR